MNYDDIISMMDYLELFTAADKFGYVMTEPAMAELTTEQAVREIISAEYENQKAKRFNELLKHSKTGRNAAVASNLKSGNGRIYNDNLARQLLSMTFVTGRRNLCIFGESGIGKTYAAKAIGIECCRNEYSTYFIDTTNLLDELLICKSTDGKKFKSRLNFFTRVQVLILDDFLITRLNEERSLILFQLIKAREAKETSTIVTCQYPASDWSDFMGAKNEPALSDAVRRRLTSGCIMEIEAAKV